MEIQTVNEIASHIYEDKMNFLINSIVRNGQSFRRRKYVKEKKINANLAELTCKLYQRES